MPALTELDVEELRVLIIDRQDRAGFYARYYDLIKDINISGARQSLPQAEISSYSGFLGGGALLGNAIAKYSNPNVYTQTLDAFSYDIALNLFKQIRIDVIDRGITVTVHLIIKQKDGNSVQMLRISGNLVPCERNLSALKVPIFSQTLNCSRAPMVFGSFVGATLGHSKDWHHTRLH